MSILDTIVARKRQEVERNRIQYPESVLGKSPFFKMMPYSLKQSLLNPNLTGVITEFKRKSPSKGDINLTAIPDYVCSAYARAGASALSVLTDSEFFGGSNSDLALARGFTNLPILRKDFIVDTYQIVEARSIGADAILLIAEVLTAKEMKDFFAFAQSLGLEVLFEVHDRESIAKLPPNAEIIGINNRNLRDFKVEINHSCELLDLLPGAAVRVAESGIDSPESLISLKRMGFQAFLIGERFMRHEAPGKAFEDFMNSVKMLENAS